MVVPTWADVANELRPFTGAYVSRSLAAAATIPSSLVTLSLYHGGTLLDYRRDPEGTALTSADGAHWSPAGVSTPEHFGAVGDGVTSDNVALTLWAAWGGLMEAGPLSSYAAPARTGRVEFADGSVTEFNRARFIQGYQQNDNTHVMEIGDNASVSGLTYEFDGAAFAQRGVYLNSGARVSDWRVTAETEGPIPNDVRDGFLVLRGPDIEISGVDFSGPASPIRFSPDVDTSRARISDIHLRNFTTGIVVDSTAPGTVIRNVYVHSISSLAAGDPGHNVVNHGAADMLVHGIYQMFEGRGSGEHFVYFSVPDGTQNVRIESVYSNGSGQCFVKLRGHDGAVLSDCHGGPTALGSAPGTNEDGFRFEYCRNVRAKALSVRKGGAIAGYDGIHLNNCWSMVFSDVSLGAPGRSYVYICTPPPIEGFTGPAGGAVSDIIINGLTATGAGVRPLVMCGPSDSDGETTVKVGNITIDNLVWDGDTAKLFTTAPGMTLARTAGTTIRIRGLVSGQRVEYTWAAADGSPTLVVV